MPLTQRGKEVLGEFEEEYGPKKGKEIFYAMESQGRFPPRILSGWRRERALKRPNPRKQFISPEMAGVLGLASGPAYYALGKPGTALYPYQSHWVTDMLAILFGAIIGWRGLDYRDSLLTYSGGAILSIHATQLFLKNGGKK